MKKLIIFLLVLVSYYSSVGQAISNRSSQTITVKDARWMAGLNAFIPVYLDTIAASQPINIGIDSCGAVIFTYNDNGVWYRGCSPKRWLRMGNGQVINDTIYTQIPIAVRTDSLGHRIIYLLHLNGLESGGLVSQHSCWSLDVTPSIAYYNYIQHSTPQVLNLLVDSTIFAFPRYVNVIIDSNNNVSVQEGTASAMPSIPQINQFSQIILTTIFIPAGASCLPFGQEVIFDGATDNPAQWTPTTSGTLTNNYVNTDTAYHLVQSAFTQTYTSGAQLIFTRPSGVDTVKVGEVAKTAFYSNGYFPNQISWQYFNGANPASNPLVINGYFNPNDSNRFQLIVVPLSAWQWPGGTVFNKFVITFGGSDLSGAKGVYHDYIQLQTGIPTQTKQYVDSVRPIGDSLYYFVNGIPHFVMPISGGGGSQTLQQVFDVENGRSVLNKYDTIDINKNSFLLGEIFGSINGLQILDSSASGTAQSLLGSRYSSSGNNGHIQTSSNSEGSSFQVDATNLVGVFSTADISGGANGTDPSYILYSADQHTFSGTITYNTPPNGSATDSVLTRDAVTGLINMRDAASFGGSETWQQTLINGSALNQNNTIDAGGFSQVFSNGQFVFQPNESGDFEVTAGNSGSVSSLVIDSSQYSFIYGRGGGGTNHLQIDNSGFQIYSTYSSPIYIGLDNNLSQSSPVIVNTGTGSSTDSVVTINPITQVLDKRKSDTTLIPSFSQKVRSLFSNTAPITYNSGNGLIGITQATTSTNGYLSSTDWNTFNNKGSGTVTSVSGTTNRITSTGGATPVIDISASYVGQSSITTLGTVTTGTLSTGAIIGGVTMTLGSDAQGDIYYRNGSGILTRLAAGTASQILHSGTTPSWKDTTATGPFSGWGVTGNTGIASATQFIGTTDSAKFKVKTKGIDAIVVDSSQNVGVGSLTSAKLSVIAPSQTGSSANSALYVSQTWNTTGKPSAFKIDVSDIAVGGCSGNNRGDCPSLIDAGYTNSGGFFNVGKGSSGNPYVYIGGNGGNPNGPGYYAGKLGDTESRIVFNINNSDQSEISFGPGNASRDFYIKRVASGDAQITGRVGIGMAPTGSSAYLLQINGAFTFGDGTNTLGRSTYTAVGGNPALASGSGKGFTFYVDDANVRAMDLSSTGQLIVGGTSTSASSILTTTSTTKGVLFSTMTASQRDAISSPATMLQVSNTTTNGIDYYNGSAWVRNATWGCKAITSTYTITNLDYTLEATSGTFTATLPDATGSVKGRVYVLTNSGSGVLTIGTTSSQTFANVSGTPTTITLNQYNTVTVQSNGTNWLTSSLFNIALSPQFQVNSSGNIVKLNNVTTSFPSSQGADSSILQNDGAGNLTWNTKLKLAVGTNSSVGQATLVGGTITVNTTQVTATSRIFLTDATTGALTNIGVPTVGTIVAGTSFVINSSNVLDTSNINWIIVN